MQNSVSMSTVCTIDSYTMHLGGLLAIQEPYWVTWGNSFFHSQQPPVCNHDLIVYTQVFTIC